VEKLGKKLAEGYRKTVNKAGLQAYAVSAGANGVLMLYPKEVRNYRDWITIDTDLWRHYWFAMVNRGVMPQPHWRRRLGRQWGFDRRGFRRQLRVARRCHHR
jgi:glutamate-1-semialdehyde 2,1-aminomutase